MKRRINKWTLGLGVILGSVIVLFLWQKIWAAPPPQIVLPNITIGDKVVKEPKGLALPFQILILMTFLTLAPYLLVMMTSFIRITIVLSFIRSALGTQQVPPTQVLMGLALFMTLYIMMPIGTKINQEALQPYLKGKLNQQQAVSKASDPIKEFMLKQTRSKDLALFYELARLPRPKSRKSVAMYVLIPAFMISEVKTAFEIGFIIYIPFLIIDMIVASVLMSMGMFMLSPMSISLPFKLLLFVMVDGWDLIVRGLVMSFH